MVAKNTTLVSALLCALLAGATAARDASGSVLSHLHEVRPVRVREQPRVIDYAPARVSLSGISASKVSVRILGADDPEGRAYQWAPYRWRQLRLAQETWHAALPAPPLRGVYQLQFRVQKSARLLQSQHWLLRVLPPGALNRPSFATPFAVIRDYVSHLPGNQLLVSARPWPHPTYDHRDRRLNRLFVIAYAPEDENRSSTPLGLFITTFRNGYHGRWRLLEATISPT